MFVFRSLFVSQNGICKPHDAHLSNFTQKDGNTRGFQETNMFVPHYTLNMFTRINFESFRTVKQVGPTKTNSPFLNFTRISNNRRFASFRRSYGAHKSQQ